MSVSTNRTRRLVTEDGDEIQLYRSGTGPIVMKVFDVNRSDEESCETVRMIKAQAQDLIWSLQNMLEAG